MRSFSDSAMGVAASLSASFIFGVMYYYATVLKPLNGMEVYGWRIIFTLPLLTLFIWKAGYWPKVTSVARSITLVRFGGVLLSAFLFGIQLWLFMWAPINGRALQVSLGYLLMPLVMVLCGRVLYKESLDGFQTVAVILAVAGVGNQLVSVGSVSWEVLTVALGFPVYFILRRKLGTDHLGGLWFDILFMMPAAVMAVIQGTSGPAVLWREPHLLALIPLLGAMSAFSIGCLVTASKLLPMGLFGLLSYVEPVLLVVVSLLLGEQIADNEKFTYVGVGLAILMLAFGGVRKTHFGSSSLRK